VRRYKPLPAPAPFPHEMPLRKPCPCQSSDTTGHAASLPSGLMLADATSHGIETSVRTWPCEARHARYRTLLARRATLGSNCPTSSDVSDAFNARPAMQRVEALEERHYLQDRDGRRGTARHVLRRTSGCSVHLPDHGAARPRWGNEKMLRHGSCLTVAGHIVFRLCGATQAPIRQEKQGEPFGKA
jgi:hypothetical protein